VSDTRLARRNRVFTTASKLDDVEKRSRRLVVRSFVLPVHSVASAITHPR